MTVSVSKPLQWHKHDDQYQYLSGNLSFLWISEVVQEGT